ncbi:MAG: T9SS type A sorting domain-containing protein [Cytophagales bacterium]|nr:T9SS type A sorting domain-containing protein [Cytophagales bacterium]
MKKITLLMTGILLATISFAQRVVGYVPSYGDKSKIQYDKITDLVYGFAELKTDGSIVLPAGFASTIQTAKNNAVRVHLSIGGDGTSGTFPTVSNSSSARQKLATELNNAITTYGLDGVDIDWEFPADWQSNQVLELVKAIKQKIGPNKELSVAVPALQYNSGAYTAASDAYIDFYHLMVYDNTLENNHSTYSFSQQSVNFWSISKGFSKSKFRLGLPFYARPTGGGEGKGYAELAGPTDAATVYNADTYFGWQYNGKATLQQKCNYALNQGLNGVMIWELTQDRTDQYSLMNAVDEIMDAGTVCSEPKLGFTKSLCGVSSVALDASVNGDNFSYKWTKDGNVVAGATQQIYNATASGTYCIDYVHNPTSGSQCPTKSTCVDVIEATSVEVEELSVCEAGEVTFETITPGQYSWFTQETGGSSVHKGENYTTTISKTTTLYIEKPAVSETVAPPYAGNGANFDKGWTPTIPLDRSSSNYRALVVDFHSDFTIDYITTYVGSTGDITIRVVDKDKNVVGSVTRAAVAGKMRVPVGIDVTAGEDYRVEVSGPIWLATTVDDNSFYGTPYDGIMTIKHMAAKTGWANSTSQYLGLYDWEVSSGASCGRTAITATVKNCVGPVVSFTKPTSKVDSDGQDAIDFEVSATDADGTISSVVFVVEKNGKEYETLTGLETSSNDTYGVSWTPTESGSYSVKVIVTDNDGKEVEKENTNSIVVEFVELNPEVSFTAPTKDVETDGEDAVDFEVSATDADGTISSVVFVIEKDGKEYETITGDETDDDTYGASFTFTESGSYSVKVIVKDNDKNEVTEESPISITAKVDDVSIEELAEFGVAVYPNPFTTLLQVDLGTLVDVDIVLYNVQGQAVAIITKAQGIKQISENLIPGIYTLQLVTSEGTVSTKVVKY